MKSYIYYILFWICTNAILLAACTKEAAKTDNNDSDLIYFVLNSDSLTSRGTPLTYASDIENLAIFGYTTQESWYDIQDEIEPDLMNNSYYTIENGSPTSSITQYWPSDRSTNVSFYSYSPFATGTYDQNSNSTGNGIELVDTSNGIRVRYSVPILCTNQPDLLLSTPVIDCTDRPEIVELTMNHALCAIGFMTEDYSLDISSIVISNVVSSGEVEIDTNSKITWYLDNATTTEFSAEMSPSQSDDGLVITSDGYLMMVPQQLGDDAQVTFKYQKSNGTNEQTTISLTGGEWEAGNKIIYNFTEGLYLDSFVPEDDPYVPYGENWVILDDITTASNYSYFKGLNKALEKVYSSGSNKQINIEFPNLEYLPSNAFNSNYYQTGNSIKSVSLPIATEIGEDAFYGCSNLEFVVIPYVETIGSSAFESCSALQRIEAPSLITIDSKSFCNCDALSSATIPLVEYIGNDAFYSCDNIANIDGPSVTRIYNSAFECCDKLERVYIPMIERLRSDVFCDTPSLKYVEMGTSYDDEISARADTFSSDVAANVTLTIGSANSSNISDNSILWRGTWVEFKKIILSN